MDRGRTTDARWCSRVTCGNTLKALPLPTMPTRLTAPPVHDLAVFGAARRRVAPVTCWRPSVATAVTTRARVSRARSALILPVRAALPNASPAPTIPSRPAASIGPATGSSASRHMTRYASSASRRNRLRVDEPASAATTSASSRPSLRQQSMYAPAMTPATAARSRRAPASATASISRCRASNSRYNSASTPARSPK
ncbi:hypothetical protein [Micromonospora fluostatini]|uniref:hypothetical protein n=1 Tax=Micromonospora sp. JCM 30529 TaxID=3421643 RepID=UPI003D162D87